MRRILYVVLRMVASDGKMRTTSDVDVHLPKGVFGMLPVYETLEDAQNEWPDSEIVQISPVEQVEVQP